MPAPWPLGFAATLPILSAMLDRQKESSSRHSSAGGQTEGDYAGFVTEGAEQTCAASIHGPVYVSASESLIRIV
jgi:hypothetical protein